MNFSQDMLGASLVKGVAHAFDRFLHVRPFRPLMRQPPYGPNISSSYRRRPHSLDAHQPQTCARSTMRCTISSSRGSSPLPGTSSRRRYRSPASRALEHVHISKRTSRLRTAATLTDVLHRTLEDDYFSWMIIRPSYDPHTRLHYFVYFACLY